MEGYNPNQSMLPSVGGNITPMSGGGMQEGGEVIRMNPDEYAIIGLTEEQFKNADNKAILKALDPRNLGPLDDTKWAAYYNEKKSDDNMDIKRNILEKVFASFVNQTDMKIQIEAIDGSDIPEDAVSGILDTFIKNAIDESKMKMTLNDTGLIIQIGDGPMVLPVSSSAAVPVVSTASPSSSPLSPIDTTTPVIPPPEVTTTAAEDETTLEGGFDTLEEAARRAAEAALNSDLGI
jgi:hypothetical protein